MPLRNTAPAAALEGQHHAPSDAQLVADVLHGDRDAFCVLVRRHQDVLYRHMRGMGLDHDTSLDVLQDAFVRAWNRLDECRDRARFRAWLFRISRNLCLDYYKDLRRLSVPFGVVEHIDQVPDPAVRSSELDLTLQTALRRLPDSLREAFLLKHDAGYSYDEIAAITESSVSAAKMRVHRAREALRAFLAAQM